MSTKPACLLKVSDFTPVCRQAGNLLSGFDASSNTNRLTPWGIYSMSIPIGS